MFSNSISFNSLRCIHMYVTEYCKLTQKVRNSQYFFRSKYLKSEWPLISRKQCTLSKLKTWCGTHTTFSYLILQQKYTLILALHSYLIFIFYALQLMNHLLLQLVFIVFELNFCILPEWGCIHLISTNKWFILHSK